MTRLAFLVFLALAQTLPAQLLPQRPARPAPTTKLAAINGKPFMVNDLRALLRNAPETVLLRLKEDPKGFLLNYTATRQLAEEAKASGVDKKFPYRQNLELQTNGVLANARLEAMLAAITLSDAEIRAYYDTNSTKFAGKSFADARAGIRDQLQQERSGAAIEKLQKSIQVKVLLPSFFTAYAAQPGLAVDAPAALNPAGTVAEVNGRPYTGQQMYELMQAMAPERRQVVAANPVRYLVQLETVQILAQEARQEGLDKKPPASDQIFWKTDPILTQAQIDEKTNSISNSDEELNAYYNKNINLFKTAKTRLIYISYVTQATAGQRNLVQARARAQEIRAKFEAGADFKALVAQYSDDSDSKSRQGEFPLKYSEPSLPAPIRDAIFAAQPGQLAGPIELPNGVYMLLVEDLATRTLEEGRQEIYVTLSDRKFKEWLDDYHQRIVVTIDDAAALKAELAYY
jgi:parvulin-like peptidyl-prolyl isomerase